MHRVRNSSPLNNSHKQNLRKMKIGNGDLVATCDYQLDSRDFVQIHLHTDDAEEIIAALDAEFGTCNYNARWTNSNLERVADAAAAIIFEQEAQAAAIAAEVLAAKKAAVAGVVELYDYAGKKKARMLGHEFVWDSVTGTYCAYKGEEAQAIATQLGILEFRNCLSSHIQRNSKGGMWSWPIVMEAWELPCSNSYHKFLIVGEHS